MSSIMPTIPKHLTREAEETAKPKNTMGKDDFLKLLMTQLRHQDPVNPMDHQQFATQLAQFSQLEQLSNIGKGIEGMQSGRGEEAKLQALGMIGKEVRASGSRVDLQPGRPVQLKYLPDAEAVPVKATVYDANGSLVREIDLMGRAAEGNAVDWDGMDAAGNPAPAGRYTFRVHGVGRNGQAKELSSEVAGKVTGIEVENNQAVLVVDTGGGGTTRIELNRISRVGLPDDKKPAAAPNGAEKQPVAARAPESEPEADLWQSRRDVSDILGRWGR